MSLERSVSGSSSGRVAVLAQDGDATRSICHALAQRFGEPHVILEQRSRRSAFLLQRARSLGPIAALGQALFAAAAVPLLRWRARPRIHAIARAHGLRNEALRAPATFASVNSDAARAALAQIDPAVVVVSGTRLIEPATLGAVDAPFLNMHAGITPLYRGVHGGYWALAEGRPELVGTTIHLLDEGLDTGPVVDRRFFAVTAADSFATYPYLHTAHGLPGLLDAVEAALRGRPAPLEALDLPSRLRYHPTLWGYLATRARTGTR
jgi:folate-dependent phosphoribosylglycinamide formyltransferase PurN